MPIKGSYVLYAYGWTTAEVGKDPELNAIADDSSVHFSLHLQAYVPHSCLRFFRVGLCIPLATLEI